MLVRSGYLKQSLWNWTLPMWADYSAQAIRLYHARQD